MKYISFFLKTLLFIMSLLSLVFLILWSVQNKDTIERTYDSILSESQKTDIECILKVPRIIPLEYLSYQYFGMKNHIAYVGGNAGFENSLKNNGNRVTEEEINAYERAVRIYSVYNKAKENSGKLSAVCICAPGGARSCIRGARAQRNARDGPPGMKNYRRKGYV